MNISILVAYTKKDRVIGSEGKIPWNIPSERFRFKQICGGKKVIMGRRTFEEIGHALPYCTIIIVSKKMKTCPKGCILKDSLKSAMKAACESSEQKAVTSQTENDCDEILVAGGEEIYTQAIILPETKKIYATEIHGEFSGDRYFPAIDENWECTFSENHTDSSTGISFDYKTFERITNSINPQGIA